MLVLSVCWNNVDNVSHHVDVIWISRPDYCNKSGTPSNICIRPEVRSVSVKARGLSRKRCGKQQPLVLARAELPLGAGGLGEIEFARRRTPHQAENPRTRRPPGVEIDKQVAVCVCRVVLLVRECDENPRTPSRLRLGAHLTEDHGTSRWDAR